MPRISQILAVEDQIKNRAHEVQTGLNKTLQRAGLTEGFVKTYRPLDEEKGDTKPPESLPVRLNPYLELTLLRQVHADHWDNVATKETANTLAKADVTLPDGTVVIADAPVTLLLFLEKKLTDLHTLVSNIPVLDPAEEWTWDNSRGHHVTKPFETFSTKKIESALVMYPATKEHPAQVKPTTEDVKVGTYITTKFSAAFRPEEKRTLLARISTLQKAVKVAREEANTRKVDEVKIADSLYDYIFSGIIR